MNVRKALVSIFVFSTVPVGAAAAVAAVRSRIGTVGRTRESAGKKMPSLSLAAAAVAVAASQLPSWQR